MNRKPCFLGTVRNWGDVPLDFPDRRPVFVCFVSPLVTKHLMDGGLMLMFVVFLLINQPFGWFGNSGSTIVKVSHQHLGEPIIGFRHKNRPLLTKIGGNLWTSHQFQTHLRHTYVPRLLATTSKGCFRCLCRWRFCCMQDIYYTANLCCECIPWSLKR